MKKRGTKKKSSVVADTIQSPNVNDNIEDLSDNLNKNEIPVESKANNTNKRVLEACDDCSDTDAPTRKPKKKKKKTQPTAESGGTNKNKKSIRQKKRERYAERQAQAAVQAKDQLKLQCLNYLSQWKHDRQNWKFMKTKQVWLFKNKFSEGMIPETSWPVLLDYFESSQGNIRRMLLDDANTIIKKMDEWTESQDKNVSNNDNDESEETVTRPDDVIYNRARSLIQQLQE